MTINGGTSPVTITDGSTNFVIAMSANRAIIFQPSGESMSWDPSNPNTISLDQWVTNQVGYANTPEGPGTYHVLWINTNTNACQPALPPSGGVNYTACKASADYQGVDIELIWPGGSSPGTTTEATTTPGAVNQQEFLFMFGIIVFFMSCLFWERLFSVSRGSYDL
jgi:hypothetical protein